MGIILMLVIGGIIGWVGSIAMRSNTRQAMLVNGAIGIAGALIGGFLLTPLLGGGSVAPEAMGARPLLLSFIGAVVLLALVSLLRHAIVR